jgi:hypothetical protein
MGETFYYDRHFNNRIMNFRLKNTFHLRSKKKSKFIVQCNLHPVEFHPFSILTANMRIRHIILKFDGRSAIRC